MVASPEVGALTEPVVRIRQPTPEDEVLVRATLLANGLTPEQSLTWLVVRDADPDQVNRLLVAGGALARTVVRERVGQLLGWLIDRQGDLAGRERNVKALVERVLSDGGLALRYRALDDAALLLAARALHGRIMAEGAPFLAWPEFVQAFCEPRREAAHAE